MWVGDLSPLLPLSQYDVVVASVVQRRKLDADIERDILLADLRFLLMRIDATLGGMVKRRAGEGMNFLPSYVAEMTQKYNERQKKSEA